MELTQLKSLNGRCTAIYYILVPPAHIISSVVCAHIPRPNATGNAGLIKFDISRRQTESQCALTLKL